MTDLTPDGKLRDLVYDFAHDLAGHEKDPANWAPWLILIFESLETEAFAGNLDRNEPEQYQLMLKQLRGAIIERLDDGRW